MAIQKDSRENELQTFPNIGGVYLYIVLELN